MYSKKHEIILLQEKIQIAALPAGLQKKIEAFRNIPNSNNAMYVSPFERNKGQLTGRGIETLNDLDEQICDGLYAYLADMEDIENPEPKKVDQTQAPVLSGKRTTVGLFRR